MAVTIEKRPQGHILDSTSMDALVTDDYGGNGANFYDPGHTLTVGQYVYVTSDIENYNGFWYVSSISGDNFTLSSGLGESNLLWVVDGVINYYEAVNTHGWSCVHLPIIYTLSNNRWPTNLIDTARTISNVTDNDGFCELTLSGDIKASGSADELDYVKVSTGDLAGIYQIIQWISDTNFVINVAYSAANDTALTNATIQYYYNNYNVRVRVFAGLSSSHYWTALKPYEQIVDLKLIPDDDGLVEVNINEFLKSKLKPLSNNTQLASLPNDIDSFCQFYISTAETYDETDGESLSTSTPSFTADSSNFEGVAVNSMLQFKNRYSGYLSEYLPLNSSSKFLTLFTEPRLFSGSYFDISFLLWDAVTFIKKEFYTNSVLQNTTYELVSPPGTFNSSLPEFNPTTSYGLGLFRKEITIPSSPTEDRVDVTLMLRDTVPYPDTSSWNDAGGPKPWNRSGANWTTTFNIGDISNYLIVDYPTIQGINYLFAGSINISSVMGNTTADIHVAIVDNSGNFLDSDTFSFDELNPPPGTTSVSLTPNGYGNRIFIWADNATVNQTTFQISLLLAQYSQISETKTINIDTECSFQDIYLTWKNYLGGMDYWKFTAQKDYISDVESATDSTQNIYPTWPSSYGEFADTIDRNTSRTSRDKIVVRSQNVTEDELNAIRYIVSSPLVQIMVSKNDRRTVKVSPGSFVWKRDEDKLYFIEFEIGYTNTIPSQSL